MGADNLLDTFDFLGPLLVPVKFLDIDKQGNRISMSSETGSGDLTCSYKVGVPIDPYYYDTLDHHPDHTVSSNSNMIGVAEEAIPFFWPTPFFERRCQGRGLADRLVA